MSDDNGDNNERPSFEGQETVDEALEYNEKEEEE